jgi:tetratricopeptide (TPR) repeat protein
VVTAGTDAKRRTDTLPVFLFLSLSFLAPVSAAWQSEELASKSGHAKELMAAGKFEQAIPIYKQLIESLPGNAGMVLNLALAEHMAGHEREAIPLFEAVLKTQPNLIPALTSLGAARLAMNQPDRAVGPLEKAVAADPADKDARGMLASALAGTGRFESAAEQYRGLTETSPDDSRAWYGLGTTYESIAREAFERLRKANPQSPFVAALVAETRVQRRQYRGALVLYQDALNQLPGLHGIHGALAETYRKTGHYDWASAEDAKERALPAADCARHPAECQFVAGHDVQALNLRNAKTPSEEDLYWRTKAANELALQAFFSLGQLPPSVELHQLQAEIARNQNQHMDSVKEWRAALDLSPGNPRLEKELAVSLFLAKDYQSALAVAGPLLNTSPRSPELNFLTGDSLLRLEQPDKSVAYLQAALAADPELRAAEASLGLALSRLGRYAEAVRHLERSLASDDDGSLHYQLARAYQAAGAVEKARVAMNRYQEILKRSQQEKEAAQRETQIGPPQ